MRYLGALFLPLLAGCIDDAPGWPLGERCGVDRNCAPGLTCRLGRCREPCTFDRDCPAGAACVETGAGRACTLADEGGCAGEEGCPEGLVCVEAEGLCREPCGEAPCAGDGWVCVGGVCRLACPAEGCGEGRLCLSGQCYEAACDADGDGFVAAACGGDDCDDASPAVHPGAVEVWDDGVDQDCDGEATTSGLEPLGPASDLEGGSGFASRPLGPPTLACGPAGCAVGRACETSGMPGACVVSMSRDSVRGPLRFQAFVEPAVGRSALAGSGLGYLLVGTSEDGLFGMAHGSLDGGPIDLPSPAISPAGEAAIAWGGSRFGLAWSAPEGAGDDVWLLPFAPEVFDARSRAPVASRPSRVEDLSVSWHGAGWGLSWSEEGGVFFASVDADGGGATGPASLGRSTAPHPTISCGGGRCGVAWTEGDGPWAVVLTVVDPAGSEVEAQRVAEVGAVAPRPDLAWLGPGWAVVFAEDEATGRVELVDPPASGAGARIGEPGAGFSWPAAAAGDGFVGVAWLDEAGARTWFVALAPRG